MTQSKSGNFRYPDGLNFDDKIAYGIGSLVMQWGATETIFFGFLECLMGREGTENGLVVWLSHRTTEARMALIRALCEAQPLPDRLREEVPDLCTRFQGVSRVRNFYCHAFYGADQYGRLQLIQGSKLVRATNQISHTEKPLSNATLNEIANAYRECEALNLDAWRALIDLRGTLPEAPTRSTPEGLEEYLRNEGPLPRPEMDE